MDKKTFEFEIKISPGCCILNKIKNVSPNILTNVFVCDVFYKNEMFM
jgi:hypothetical protein